MSNKQKTYVGLKKAGLYSYPPYEKGLCGPKANRNENLSLILNFIKKPVPTFEEEERVRKLLLRFPVVCGYYRQLAKLSGTYNIFNETVVGNYWVGGRLLDKATKKNCNGVLPFHTYHVLFIGSTGNIKFDLAARDLCRITLAKVVKTQLAIKKVLVEYRPLAQKNEKIFLNGEIRGEVDWDAERVSQLAPGNFVSLHWGKIIEVLNHSEALALKQYTSIAIDIYNSRVAE